MPRLLALLVAAPLALAFAPAAGAQTTGTGRAIDAICSQVVGVSPGERYYVACVSSLAHSAVSLQRGERLAAARGDCLAAGARPGSPELARCELNAADGSLAGPVSEPPPDSAVPGGRRSYFEVSGDTALERDRLACADLGFEPAGSGFDQCAIDLRVSLSQASMAMH